MNEMVLHVLNGDSTRRQLERSELAGTFTVWADVLHDGPVPGGLDPEAFRQVRAQHLASRAGQPEPEVLATLEVWDAALDAFNQHEEVVFWLEHDLFDQLILIRHLHWLSRIERSGTRFSLICAGGFPGVEDFHGLGQLSPRQLTTLYPARQEITPAQIETGRIAWDLYRQRDPAALSSWLEDGAEPLPYLAGAMHRHFEDYPSIRDGLSRTERQMLVALAEGNDTFGSMFRAGQVVEERVYMGDQTFAAILRDLMRAPHPLVEAVRPEVTAALHLLSLNSHMRLTRAGLRVMEGRADHVELNGIDRWMGGVHLRPQHLWRSDGEALVPPR